MKNIPTNNNLNKFFNFNIEDLVNEYKFQSPEIIENQGFDMALKLFLDASERVPAYKDFLQKNKINPKNIKTLNDFKQIPVVDKKNYLNAYSLKDLCWNGELKSNYIISSSSGSTGRPFLWPRGEEQELEGAQQHELIFKEVFEADKKSTLVINCFAQGVWIAGIFTLACTEYLTRKGYNIVSLNPGLDTNITLSLFKQLAHEFDQVVFCGYPPYLKDLLEKGRSIEIDWRKYQIKFLFAAEGFSEKWREYMHQTVDSKDHLTSSINVYGSADAAALANETPLTTAIRRRVSDNISQVGDLFHENRLPTLAQYDPRIKYMENVNNTIVFTTRAGIPLVRYSIGDTGGTYSYREMGEKLKLIGININHVLNETNKKYLWRLPFVYVFGRNDFTVSLYGLLIYPEHIKFGLESSSVQKYITGKFVMSIELTDKFDPFLLLKIELAIGVKQNSKLKHEIVASIVKGLRQVNTEYRKLHQTMKDKTIPVIELVENGETDHFKTGIKQRWVKKNN